MTKFIPSPVHDRQDPDGLSLADKEKITSHVRVPSSQEEEDQTGHAPSKTGLIEDTDNNLKNKTGI